MSTIHLVKLCVGADSVDSLLAWETQRPEVYRLHTRNRPKRFAELVDGGSLYWVIKGVILCRREIVSFDVVEDQEKPLCWIGLRNRHILTEPQPRRPFQGWRYLEAKDAPRDLNSLADQGLPNELAQQLKESGVW
jgi:hypothetical protein